jgi:hypothetical protein
MEEVNGCMTRECIVGLDPELVPLILFGGTMPTNRRIVIQRGVSHVYEE